MNEPEKKKELTDEEWRRRLSAEEYAVCRQGGTEPAFSGAYWDSKTPGIYRCACCDIELFRSNEKFDSGSGWPSHGASRLIACRKKATRLERLWSLALNRQTIRQTFFGLPVKVSLWAMAAVRMVLPMPPGP